MLKKLIKWFKGQDNFGFAVAFASSIIVLGLFIAFMNSGSKTPVKLAPISVANQLEALSYSDDLSAIQSNKDRKIEGLLPVTVLPSNQYIKLLEANSAKVSTATVNPDTRITAMAVVTGKVTNLYASYFLTNQTDLLMSDYSQGSTKVNVTPVGSGNPGGLSGYANYSRYSVLSNYMKTSSQPAPTKSSNGFFSPFNLFLLLIIFVVLFTRYTRRRSRMKLKTKEITDIPKVRFEDVAGCDEAIEDVKEYSLFINDPERFTKLGALPPKGALLVGPPGTGKTLLARALAGEAGLPFINVAGSDFVEMYVGVGAKRVRELFEKAEKHPDGAIIFIDEIDSIGRARGKGLEGAGNTEQESTLNALLVAMDGFKKNKVIVLGATNRPDMLDPALTRPGRFDKKIHVPLPDVLGREQIFNVHLRGKPISSKVSVNLLAKRTYDMSGADIAQVVNEACMFAARNDREEVMPEDFSEAIETVFMGKARTSAIVTEKDKILTAWHEAGHTVSAMVLDDANRPGSVSIIPRGPAGGITWMIPDEAMYLTRKAALAGLVVAMSGRAAEELLLNGEFTSGPHGDLTSATETAMTMVTKYGMIDGALMVKNKDTLSEKNIEAVEILLNEALNIARKTLATHRELFDSVVSNLLEYETLSHEQLVALRNGAKIVPPALPAAPRNALKKPQRKKETGKSSKDDSSSSADDGFDLDAIRSKIPFKKKKAGVLGSIANTLESNSKAPESDVEVETKPKSRAKTKTKE